MCVSGESSSGSRRSSFSEAAQWRLEYQDLPEFREGLGSEFEESFEERLYRCQHKKMSNIAHEGLY